MAKARQIVNSQFSVTVESVNDISSIKPEAGAMVVYKGGMYYADGTKWIKIAAAATDK